MAKVEHTQERTTHLDEGVTLETPNGLVIQVVSTTDHGYNPDTRKHYYNLQVYMPGHAVTLCTARVERTGVATVGVVLSGLGNHK